MLRIEVGDFLHKSVKSLLKQYDNRNRRKNQYRTGLQKQDKSQYKMLDLLSCKIYNYNMYVYRN